MGVVKRFVDLKSLGVYDLDSIVCIYNFKGNSKFSIRIEYMRNEGSYTTNTLDGVSESDYNEIVKLLFEATEKYKKESEDFKFKEAKHKSNLF